MRKCVYENPNKIYELPQKGAGLIMMQNKGRKGNANKIYVEGNNDYIVFDKITNCAVHRQDGVGKESILNILKEIDNDNIYGIVDRDYDEEEQIKNIIYTDYNDIECTALNTMKNEEIVTCLNLLNVYKDFNIDKVKNVSRKFSLLWLYFYDEYGNTNKRPKYLTNFEDSERIFEKILNKELEINYKNLKEKYKEKESKVKCLNINYKEIMELQTNNINFRGHDFFEFLYLYMIKNDFQTKYLYKNSFGKKYEIVQNEFVKKSLEKNWIYRTKIYEELKKYSLVKE